MYVLESGPSGCRIMHSAPAPFGLMLIATRPANALAMRAWLVRQFSNFAGNMVYPDLCLWDLEMGYIATGLLESALLHQCGEPMPSDLRHYASMLS